MRQFAVQIAVLLMCLGAVGEARTLKAYVTNQYGRVGILISNDGRVDHVYGHSPAFGVLKVGDVVLSADGTPGIKNIDGQAGTVVDLEISRDCGCVFYHYRQTIHVLIPRTSPQFIYNGDE